MRKTKTYLYYIFFKLDIIYSISIPSHQKDTSGQLFYYVISLTGFFFFPVIIVVLWFSHVLS